MHLEAAIVNRLSGARIIDLQRQVHRFAGTVSSESNVIFLKLDNGSWLRIFFDAGVFFWREVVTPDAALRDGDSEYFVESAVPSDKALGLVIKVSFLGNEGEAVRAFILELESGTSIRLLNESDENTLTVSAEVIH